MKNRITIKMFLFMVMLGASQMGMSAVLKDISFSELPGERAEIRLEFDSAPQEPAGYTIEKPARIVLDFSGVENALSQKKYPMSVGKVNSSVIVSGGGRTRLIVNLDDYTSYKTSIDGNELVISVGAQTNEQSNISLASDSPSVSQQSGPVLQASSASSDVSQITSLDFRRGEVGEGKTIITLSNPKGEC